MNQEERAKLANLIWIYTPHASRGGSEICADALIKAGYRLVPDLKLISDDHLGRIRITKSDSNELHQRAIEGIDFNGAESQRYARRMNSLLTLKIKQKVARAQLDSINRQLEGK